MAFALEDSEYGVDLKTGEFLAAHPEYFGAMLGPGVQVIAHNSHFEYAIWNYILHKRHGWPALWEPRSWGCTMSRAAMCNIPISLDGACSALGLKAQKDLMGRSAMLKLSRPISEDALGFPTYREDKDLKETLYEYCKKDVAAEMELDARLPELPENERKVWELDLLINRRGVKADVLAAGRAVGMADSFTTRLNDELKGLTGGAVEKASIQPPIWGLLQGLKPV
jgi:DNA polymerase